MFSGLPPIADASEPYRLFRDVPTPEVAVIFPLDFADQVKSQKGNLGSFEEIRRSGPRVRLHDLRHGHATHLLAANTHPKIVQERLGHASIQLTLDTYSHVIPSMQEDAAATIDAAMRAALKRK